MAKEIKRISGILNWEGSSLVNAKVAYIIGDDDTGLKESKRRDLTESEKSALAGKTISQVRTAIENKIKTLEGIT